MKRSKLYLIGAVVLMALSACVSEEIPSGSKDGAGKMQVDVDILRPQATRAGVNTADYPITIYKADGTVEKEYEKLSLVPKQISLSVGQYFVEAHTPGEMDKIMDSPYYIGTEPVTILKGINTRANVVCRMGNGSFEVKYSDTFATAFTSWKISIDDGGESAITFDHWMETMKQYMAFEKNVSELSVNFVGITAAGNRITMANTLTKRQASEQYDDDNEYFSGGDAIVLNFEPVESSEGKITGITLTADIQFEESETTYPMEVEDKELPGEGGPEGDDNGGENTGGGADNNAITLNLPEDMTVSGSTDPALGNTYIAAEHGIKSIKVKIASTSDEMVSSLNDLAGNYEGIDFMNGTEVVDNQGLVSLFTDLGQTLVVPSEGATEYTFPIGNFFGLLQFLPGEHTFTLTITDMQGNTKNGKLKLTV